MKFLLTKTNLFLLSLAASDLLSGILVIPLVIPCNLVYDSEQICIAMDICQRGLAISTILHLACAVTERYLKSSAPFKYVSLVTRPRIFSVIFCLDIRHVCIPCAVDLVCSERTGKRKLSISYIRRDGSLPRCVCSLYSNPSGVYSDIYHNEKQPGVP